MESRQPWWLRYADNMGDSQCLQFRDVPHLNFQSLRGQFPVGQAEEERAKRPVDALLGRITKTSFPTNVEGASAIHQ
jgi:hypothetical protein